LPKHAREEAVEPLVVARRHRVTHCAHVAVVDQQMLRAEMRIQHRGEEEVRERPLQPVPLVHQLVRVVDPDGPAEHADAKEEAELLRRAERAGGLREPDHVEDHGGLEREPDQRDEAIGPQRGIRRLRVGVRLVQPRRRVEYREEPPCAERHQHQPPAADVRDRDDQRDERERCPEGQRGRQGTDLRRRDHGTFSPGARSENRLGPAFRQSPAHSPRARS
jgi:hypothetical protein